MFSYCNQINAHRQKQKYEIKENFSIEKIQCEILIRRFPVNSSAILDLFGDQKDLSKMLYSPISLHQKHFLFPL
jgi:hypothetical protein